MSLFSWLTKNKNEAPSSLDKDLYDIRLSIGQVHSDRLPEHGDTRKTLIALLIEHANLLSLTQQFNGAATYYDIAQKLTQADDNDIGA